MSGAEPVDQQAASRRRKSIAFRKRGNAPAPTDQSRRQSDIIQSASRHFHEAAPVIPFLNSRHEALEGQPLHLAIESDEGLRRVERMLQHLNV